MTTPNFSMTPDFTPVLRLMEFQTKLAFETSRAMMDMAMLPWQAFGVTPFASANTAPVAKPAAKKPSAPTKPVLAKVAEMPKAAIVKPAKSAQPLVSKPTEVVKADMAKAAPIAKPVVVKKAEPKPVVAKKADPKPVVAKKAEPKPAVAKTTEPKAEAKPVAKTPAPKAEAMTTAAKTASVDAPLAVSAQKVAPVSKPAPAPVAKKPEPAAEGPQKPKGLGKPRTGGADMLTDIKGLGPALEAQLNEIGIYHFEQIAAWSDAEVAWIDGNLKRVMNRASRDNWAAQAKALSAPKAG